MSEIAAAFGADLILLNLFDVFEPKVSGLEVKDAKGTVPGFTSDELIKIVKIVHQHDGLVMSTIGTSQESSGKDVIREIALKNKMSISNISGTPHGACCLQQRLSLN